MRCGLIAGASLAVALTFPTGCASGSDPSTVSVDAAAADAAVADDGTPSEDTGSPAVQTEAGSRAGDAGDGALDGEAGTDATADGPTGDGDADASSSALACAMDGERCTETAGCCAGGVTTQCLGGYCADVGK